MNSYVFIDSKVPDFDSLLAGLDPDAIVVILDSAQDGLVQIAQALEGVSNLDAIHIVSHGSAGALYLGASTVDEAALDGYATALATIGSALTDSGDILLYGCNVAQGDAGARFITQLAAYTGAEVAASTDYTGAAALGGDWVLEAATGAIESAELVYPDYSLLLDLIHGDAGDNVLFGGPGNDQLYGEAGDDFLFGGAGDDFLFGGAGNDILYGGGDDDILYGEANDDVLYGGLGNDQLYGEAGNDSLHGGVGADYLDGGAGTDWADYYGAVTGVQVDLIKPETNTGESAGDTLVSIENLRGSALNDTLRGDTLDNALVGDDGDDILSGGAGNDQLYGEAGDDQLYGEAGDDFLSGGAGNDFLSGEANDDVLYGGAGDDQLYGEAGDDFLSGGDGNDTLHGGDGTDTASYSTAAAGVTVNLALTDAQETVGAGTDVLIVIENLIGSNSSDTLTGDGGANRLEGGAGDDTLIGGAGDDILSGGAGNDQLLGGGGSDTMQGGVGDDSYYVDNVGDSVVENAYEGTDEVRSTISYTLPDNVEYLILTGAGNINGTGNSLDNLIFGNTGVNVLAGGAGNDAYILQTAGSTVVENPSEGIDTVLSPFSFTLGANVENLTLTGSANINGTGNSLANTLVSNAGINTLTGGDGTDTYVIHNSADIIVETPTGGTEVVTADVSYALPDNVEHLFLLGFGNINATGNALQNVLVGNLGSNTLTGGAGDDIYFVQTPGATIAENPGEGNDTLFNYVTMTLDANVEDMRMQGTASINGTGNVLDNVLTGNSGNNILDGGAGNDTMVGGTGDDTYIVDSTADVVTENPGEGTDQVQSSASYTLPDNVEYLILTGAGNINGTSNSLDNLIFGNAGVNVLTGGAGNDAYILQTAGSTVVENPGEGIDTVISAVSFTLGANVENLTLTGSANINGTGNSLANTLVSNTGINTLTGGDGTDTYVIRNSADTIVETPTGGTDIVTADVSYTLPNNVEHLFLLGFGSINATGNALQNVLVGNLGINTLTGGAGDDIYFVQASGATIVENPGEGRDTLFNFVTMTLDANVEDMRMQGTASINGTGNALDNVLTGNSGSNVLNGKAGNDTLIGGGGGNQFVFDTALNSISNVDTITDFATASDKIVLDHAIFTALIAGNLGAGSFVAAAGAAALDANDFVLYDTTSGDLFYDPDGSAAQAATLFASLSLHPALAAADFTIT